MPHPFAGGIDVDEHKNHRGRSSRRLPLPQHLRISLPPTDWLPAVTVGQRVMRGDVLATAPIRLHAPTSGRVSGLGGSGPPTLDLEPDGEDATREQVAWHDVHDHSAEDILMRIELAGIPGLGGGGYPAHHKLRAARAHDVHTLVVNAVECEPWLTADEVLIRECIADLRGGIEAVQRVLPDARLVIAIDPRKHDAIATLTAAGYDHALMTTAPRFPAGAERMIFTALTGHRLRSGERPIARGHVFLNVATLFAIARAVLHGEPVTERLISVTGPRITDPGTAWVRIGTPPPVVLEAFGLTGLDAVELRAGGPLTGAPLDLDAGIGKTTLALFAETARAAAVTPCIRCGRCMDACPEGLAPQILHFAAMESSAPTWQSAGLDACIECGACEPVCPSRLPLLTGFRAAKAGAAERARRAAMAARAQARFAAHQQRQAEAAAAAALRRRRRLAQRLGSSPADDEPS